MKVRILTGIVFGVSVLGLLFWGSIGFMVLLGLLVTGCTYELHEFFRSRYKQQNPGLPDHAPQLGQLRALSLFRAFSATVLFLNYTLWPQWWVAGLLCFVLLEVFLRLYQKPPVWPGTIAWAWFGWVWIIIPFALFWDLAHDFPASGANHAQAYSALWVLGIFLAFWFSDTGAYLVGSRWGKHLLWPKHSPKKTWEGFVGSVIISTGLMWTWAQVLQSKLPDTLNSPVLWAGIGLCASLAGSLGDLFESALKREFSIKDSGDLLPGHGGLLDRFDAFLLGLPLIWLWVQAWFSV